MWPTLVSVGPIAIQSFGFLMFLGVFFGGFVWWQKGREEGFEEEALMDHWLMAGIAAVILGRAGYILSHWNDFGGSWYKILFLTKFPGLSYEGAWLGAGLGLVVLGAKKGWDLWRMLEAGVFGFLAVEIFAWLGSFLGGGSLGKETSWGWGLAFPGVEAKRHPVQLLWFLGLWLLFKLLKKWEKEYRGFKWYQHGKDEAKPGFLVAAYLIGLGLMRLGLGFLMEARRLWFSLGLLILGGLILIERSGIKIGSLKKPTQVAELKKKKVSERRKKQGFDFK
jgi:phosphatidylglycerol:prolipoprotein diacylglycerol transferase